MVYFIYFFHLLGPSRCAPSACAPAGQKRGEIANQPGRRDDIVQGLDDIGLDDRRVAEWREVAEAGGYQDQREFVAWWDKNVRVRQGARTDLNAERGLSREDAEGHTGKDKASNAGLRSTL